MPKKRRLLIVDDETDLRNLLSDVLGIEGYEIVTAADGEEAIDILGTQTFDAALLDIMMPKRGGMDVLKHITANHPGTKTIILTGYTDLRSAVEAKKHGAADYITKPYKLEVLISTLDRVIGR